MIPYGKQSISKEDINAVVKILKSEYLTQGPTIEEFEHTLTDYVGVKYAVVFNSGTAALHAAYFAVGLNKGDEFITSPMTFAATANAGLYLGAKPVFVDIEEGTGNIDPQLVESLLTKKTKLIAPVHYAGFPVDLIKIQNIARKHNLFVIEDASHALGAIYHKTKIGSCTYSDITTFSFHPVKHITTGEGGAATTNDKKLYEKMIMFRTHGITKEKSNLINQQEGEWYHEMQMLGFNYRMTDFQAALGLSQLHRLNSFLKRRREIAVIYDKAFTDNLYFDVIEELKDLQSAYHLYPILLKNPKKKKIIFETLRKKGIGVQVHYIPVYFHPYYQSIGYKKGLCPKAELFYQKEISIPMYPNLNKKDIKYVVNTILAVCIPFLLDFVPAEGYRRI